MRISGLEVSARKPVPVVLPRGNTQYTIWCHPVDSYAEFDAMVPKPLPRVRMLPGGKQEPDTGAAYKAAIDEYAAKRTYWLVLSSLKNIEWDTVKLDDPSTWSNYDKELADNFSAVEINTILDAVFTACGMHSKAIETATKDFLASLEVPAES